MSRFVFGKRSERELIGVHPNLTRVARRALEITPQDFSAHDGLRVLAEQKELVASGASRTLHSQHLRQADGYGHAMDLVPYVNGKMRWEWGPIYKVVEAVRMASIELNTAIRWGGIWTRLDLTTESPEALIAAYIEHRRAIGRKAFIDGPHFDLKGCL